MKIIGRGLIAQTLFPHLHELEDVVIFASGVADSTTIDPAEFQREYALLYETLQAALPARQRVVYFSSGGAVYGPFEGQRGETTPAFPTTPYGRHKLLCEAIVRQSTLPYLILRLPNLVGARQNKWQLVPALIHQARRGKVMLYQQATRDLLDVEDFAAILMRLLRLAITGETIVVASGFAVPVEQIYAAIREALHTQAAVELVPKGDQQRFSIDKLRRLLDDDLPFQPDYYQDVIRKYARSIADLLP